MSKIQNMPLAKILIIVVALLSILIIDDINHDIKSGVTFVEGDNPFAYRSES